MHIAIEPIASNRCTLIWTGSGPNLDQCWTKSGIEQKRSGPISATTQFPNQFTSLVSLLSRLKCNNILK